MTALGEQLLQLFAKNRPDFPYLVSEHEKAPGSRLARLKIHGIQILQ
jgi:hypothetical protein